MATTKLTFSGAIAAPIEDVFALLTDPKRMPAWFPGCTEVEAQGALVKGTKFRLRLQTTRHARDIQAEVVDFAPPTVFGWTEMVPRAGSKTFFRLRFEGGSTGVTMQQISTRRGLLTMVRSALFSRRNAKRQFDQALQNLQRALMR